MQPDQSEVVHHKGGGITFAGADAVEYYRIVNLRSFIKLHKNTGMIPTRGVTITKMLAAVSQLTGKPYKGKTKHDSALADLDQRIAAYQASLPVRHD